MENQNSLDRTSAAPVNPYPQPDPQPTPSPNYSQSTAPTTKKSPLKKLLWALISAAVLLVVVYLTYVVSTAYVITKLDKAYVINGPSMSPALNSGDKVLVANYDVLNTKLYNTSTSINDLVVFHTTFEGKSYTLIKRVVALAGQRVVIASNKLTVYDTAHPSGFDPTAAYGPSGDPTPGSADVIVPTGDVYVLGDNRPNSLDSRAFGPIQESSLIGKVIGKVTQP